MYSAKIYLHHDKSLNIQSMNREKCTHKCSTCCKKFISAGALHFHKYIMHNELEYFCEICRFNLPNNTYLKYNHLVTIHGYEDSLQKLDLQGLDTFSCFPDDFSTVNSKYNLSYLNLMYHHEK